MPTPTAKETMIITIATTCKLAIASGRKPKASPSVDAKKITAKPEHMPIQVVMMRARRPAFSMINIAMKVMARLTSDSSVWLKRCGGYRDEEGPKRGG